MQGGTEANQAPLFLTTDAWESSVSEAHTHPPGIYHLTGPSTERKGIEHMRMSA